MTIEEILNSENSAESKIAALKEKTIVVPVWSGRFGLVQQFDPTKHPVMNKQKYPDIVTDEGIEYVTRVTCDLQRLATKRMTELVTGIPIKRVYKPENDRQKEIASYLENIYERNRIDSVNNERCNMLFAGCEVFTLWYAIEERNTLYGFTSPLKLRCRNFSPMLGDELYPLFDEYGDMIAMSVGYTRKKGRKYVQYFDTYTADKHIKWSNENGGWAEVENENITLGKIPGVYAWRPTPIWEDTSKTVYEIISYGDEKSPNREFRSVMQYPQNGRAEYVTWAQAVENLKFYVEQLRDLFFTQLQLPDWSYGKMSQQALSGESRKQMFIDAQLKVKDESGRLIEFFDREMNVVKAFAKIMLGESYAADIDALKVETLITPFAITDEKDTINNLMAANGGKALMSQRESIEMYGHSDDVDKTLHEIAEEDKIDAFEMTE